MRFRVLLFAVVASYLFFLQAGENYTTLQAGYHDGFYVKTEDDKFLLKVGTRLNFAYTYGFDSPLPDFSSFDLIHAKLYAGGNAYGPNVQYYFQAAAANNTRPVFLGPKPESNTGDFKLEDYYVRLLWNDMYLKFGQFKVPFVRQWMIYSGNLEFVNRSIAANYFAFGRDRGVTLGSDRESFAFSIGVFNGGGSPAIGSGFSPATFSTNGQNVSNDTASGGRGHLYVARISALPMGAAGYSEGDVENSEGSRLEIGAGFLYDQGRSADINGDGAVDDNDVDTLNASGELTWKDAGKSFQGEFFYRRLTGSVLPNIKSIGFNVQPGIFIVPSKFELAGRFSWIDPNMSISKDNLWEAAAVGNFYISGDHRYKAQLQYTWRGQDSAAGRNDDYFIDLMFQLTL